jgi:DHA1 family tetracycline resistance protein-like MFS transporter
MAPGGRQKGDRMTHRASLGFVLGIVLIDMLGFGIVIPVFPGLIMHLAHVSITQAAQYAGWLSAGYAAMQFVFAPVIGNLSDRFGRRPVLLAAVLALGLDYLLQAFAPAMSWLVAGRIIAGITGASFSAAYAYIADVTPPEKRASAFGLIGMAFGIGFVVGPAAGAAWHAGAARAVHGGLRAQPRQFRVRLVHLARSLDADHRRAFDWRRANALSSLAVLKGQGRQVLWYVAALGVWQLANVVYPAIWTYFAIAAYGLSTKAVGIALAVVGLTAALFQGVGMRYLLPVLGERRAVIVGVISLGLSALAYAWATHIWQVYLAIAIGAFQGAVLPSISAMNSRAVDARSQGELQGAVQSIGSIAQIVGPPLYAQALARFSGPQAIADLPAMPMLLAATIGFVSLALFLKGAAGEKA